jgi:hypothetical protein
MVTSHIRGHEIFFDNDQREFLYSDSLGTIRADRACNHCGKQPTPEGYDACLGHIEGAVSACCGHGIDEKFVIMRDDLKEVG